MAPELAGIDHIHVFVSDRADAERWDQRVLGCERVSELEQWAADSGPLTVESGGIHLALFERPPQPNRATIALKVSGRDFLAWRSHLRDAIGEELEPTDHDLSWSLYFSDPYGNPYEITSYDYHSLANELRTE